MYYNVTSKLTYVVNTNNSLYSIGNYTITFLVNLLQVLSSRPVGTTHSYLQ